MSHPSESLICGGTLDLVFIESQAAGIAVVGPRAVAVPLVVEEGVNGCLYTPLDMKDAKRAIKDLFFIRPFFWDDLFSALPSF